jgi:uncharacterized membrane protein required for colicin V production
MNSIDLIVLVVILLNGAIGAFRGFTWQAFRLGSVILAFWLGSRFAVTVAEAPPITWLGWDNPNDPMRTVLAWVGILLVTYACMAWLGHLMRGWIEKARLTSSDRSLGFLLGSAKGIIFVAIALHVLVLLKPLGCVPQSWRAQLWGQDGGEDGSRAVQLHEDWLRSSLDKLTPDELKPL